MGALSPFSRYVSSFSPLPSGSALGISSIVDLSPQRLHSRACTPQRGSLLGRSSPESPPDAAADLPTLAFQTPRPTPQEDPEPRIIFISDVQAKRIRSPRPVPIAALNCATPDDLPADLRQQLETFMSPKAKGKRPKASIALGPTRRVVAAPLDMMATPAGRMATVRAQSNSPYERRCKCKKSKCLKLYCDCFAVGDICNASCACLECHNTPAYKEEREKAIKAIRGRNPNAFQIKIQSDKHARGCQCKKTACLKKYCECFQAGILCASNCRCSDCQNFEGSEQLRLVRMRKGSRGRPPLSDELAKKKAKVLSAAAPEESPLEATPGAPL